MSTTLRPSCSRSAWNAWPSAGVTRRISRQPGESKPLPWPSTLRISWYSHGRHLLEHVELRRRIDEAERGAAKQAQCGLALGSAEVRDRLLDVVPGELQPELGRLVHDLEEELVAMHPLVRPFLEREQADGVQVALVVAAASPGRIGWEKSSASDRSRHGRSILRPCPTSSQTPRGSARGLRAARPARSAAHARRARRPAARARARLGAAPLDRGGPAPLADPLRPAGRRQDDAGADRRRDDRRRLRGALGGLRPRRRRPRACSRPRATGSAATDSGRSSSSTRSTASTRPSRTRCCPRSRTAS